MDERLSKALDLGNFMITFNTTLKVLKEKYQADLLFFYNGGEFIVSQSLISFVKTLIDYKQTDAILIDEHKNPIYVEDLNEFSTNIIDAYTKASNQYFNELTKLKKTRSVERLLT